jgi:hypothetical protein
MIRFAYLRAALQAFNALRAFVPLSRNDRLIQTFPKAYNKAG